MLIYMFMKLLSACFVIVPVVKKSLLIENRSSSTNSVPFNMFKFEQIFNDGRWDYNLYINYYNTEHNKCYSKLLQLYSETEEPLPLEFFMQGSVLTTPNYDYIIYTHPNAEEYCLKSHDNTQFTMEDWAPIIVGASAPLLLSMFF